MYPTQSMRNFVCDRLTAAAREIVGAFEKRIEDYEAEIARQRRMLDTVFTPETKFHRSENDFPSKEGQVVQNQQHVGSQEEDCRLASSLITQIKDEHEEICISQEPPRQAQPSSSPPTPAPSVSEDQCPPSRSNQPETTEPGESLSITSKKDAEPQPDRESFAVSAAEDDLKGLSKTNDKPENEDQTALNDGCETPTRDMESNPDEEMPDVSSPSAAASTEQMLEKKTDGEDIEDITQRLDQNCTNVSLNDSDELMQLEASNTELEPASSRFEEETGRVHTDTPGCPDEALDSHPNPTGTDEDQTRKGSEESAAPDELQIRSPENVEEPPKEKDGKQTAPENEEQTSPPDKTTEENQHERPEKSLDGRRASATPTEKSLNTVHKKTDQNTTTSPKRRERSLERPNSCSDPTARRRLGERKTASSGAMETRLHQRHEKKMGPREDGIPGSSQSAGRPSKNPAAAPDPTCAPNECTHPTATRKSHKEKTSSSSKSGKRRRLSHEETAVSGNAEPPQESRRAGETNGRENVKVTSKPKTNASSPAESSQAKASKKANDENKSSRSKKEPPQKRPNDRSSDSKQKKQKEGSSSTSRKSEEEKLQRRQKTKSCEKSDWGTSSDCAEEKVENPYKCDRCGKVMSNFKNYKFHMKSHTVEKTFKCETCGKMFRESWDLNKHLVIHASEKPYKCEICGNGFNRRYNLDLHLRVHTGEKPYKCSVCSKSFSSCVNMKKHLRVHTGEKPYICKDCGKEFADSSAFKNHLRVHTGEKPFKCTLCKKKFATRTTLKRHNRTHTGEKPYECHVCNKKFGHKSDLKGHLRLHTGEKPYECSVCEEKFSTWLKLHKHKRVHTKVVEEPSSSD